MPSPENNPELHGNVPDQCAVVLLLIDVINGLDFEGSEEFAIRALAKAHRIAALRESAWRAAVPVFYLTTTTSGAGARTLAASSNIGSRPMRPADRSYSCSRRRRRTTWC
jgi:hypothetical protein